MAPIAPVLPPVAPFVTPPPPAMHPPLPLGGGLAQLANQVHAMQGGGQGAAIPGPVAGGLPAPGAGAIPPVAPVEIPIMSSPADLRVLDVKYNSLGNRHREMREAFEASSTDAWPDFPIVGPHTALWCINRAVTNCGTFKNWHEHWKVLCKLTEADPGVGLHGSACTRL